MYTALFDPAATGDLIDPRRVRVSALQRLPFAKRGFRYFAPLYPAVFEALRPVELRSTSSVRRVRGPRACGPHRERCTSATCNTVSRFVFAYERYLGGFGLARAAQAFRGAARQVGRRRRAASERVHRKLAQCGGARRSATTAGGATCCTRRSISTASRWAKAAATISSSSRACCRTSASTSRSKPARSPAKRLVVAGEGPARSVARTRRRRNAHRVRRRGFRCRGKRIDATRARRCSSPVRKTTDSYRSRPMLPAGPSIAFGARRCARNGRPRRYRRVLRGAHGCVACRRARRPRCLALRAGAPARSRRRVLAGDLQAKAARSDRRGRPLRRRGDVRARGCLARIRRGRGRRCGSRRAR